MPSRNSIKQYIANGYYHIYNRGVEKRLIFQDEQDYSVFLSYLKEYLLPKDVDELTRILQDENTSHKEKDKAVKLLRLNNFCKEITLIAYCLMPNHFHFLLSQKNSEAIDKFMRSLGTRYTMYFNRKYKRVGSLYQVVYKAVLVETDEQLLHLSRYIHKQALASQGETLRSQPSSYPEYLKKRKTDWINPRAILSFFAKSNNQLSYKNFVTSPEEKEISLIQNLIIEDE